MHSPPSPRRESRTLVCMLPLLVFGIGPTFGAQAPSSREALKVFAEPSRDHASGPLWVWNDRLTEEQIRSTLRDLAGQKVLQVFVHPRPGLMTPYLSEEWFRLWKVALDEAETLDMNVWIYDENSYPSGFAGGFVPEAMPESRGRGLHFRESKTPPTWSESTVAVYRATEPGFEDVSESVRSRKELPTGEYVVAEIRRAPISPWHGGRYYVDLLYPGVTEKFLEITLGAYKREVGDEFGKRIPGVFTDEPEILPAGGLPWTADLPEVFEKRWGYSLLANLPSLARPVGDFQRVRHNYYQTLLDLFIERWAKPYYEYCEREGLEFTGHYWEHEWPRCTIVPDNMAMSAWQQRPGIDILMNRYAEDTHAQFGNVRAVRELASVASQLTRPRTLCEAYGAAGWELRFADMKRIADWLYVLGVNTMNEHLSYVTLRGARKKDHPQSFSYHEPWWEAYHARAEYTTRLSAALTQGNQVQEFLILEPTTTAWLYQADPTHAERLKAIGDRFQSLLMSLERAQVGYDIGCEDIIARHGSVLVRRLKVGKRGYRAVVLPPFVENLNSKTVELLDELAATGGMVLFCDDLPRLVDGRPIRKDESEPAPVPYGWQKVTLEELPAFLSRLSSDGFSIERSSGDEGILFHHRRKLSDGELVFLVNSSDTAPSTGTVRSPARGVERWDLETGKAVPIVFQATNRGMELPFDLPPCGSLLVFLSWDPREPAPDRELQRRVVEPEGPPAVRRLDPNVLALDYVDVTAGGESLEHAHVYRAGQFAFRKNGMERNPWDSAVQFRDEMISRTFPPESGFRATYRFTVEEEVPKTIAVVVERPDLYTVQLNGVKLPAADGSWWLDRSFGKLDAHAAARVGENTLELTASPFTIYHEIEAAYVVGDFGVQAKESGFAIVPEPALAVGPWKDRLLPLYGHRVAYAQTFELPSKGARYRVRLPSWNGSVAKVIANGSDAGFIESPPYERDITEYLKPGTNTIQVVVYGTLKNTLGPHHAGSALGSAWPAMFHQGPEQGPPPGKEYATVPYGLFQPFTLEESKEALRSEYDVVVYGGTAAGVIAAVQAKRMGKTAVIVCPDRHLGGLSSGGLGFTDTGNKATIGGLSREFYHRVWKHYREDDAWAWQKREEYGNRGQGTPAIDGEQRTMWIFEPHVAEKVFEDLVGEHQIPVFRDEWIDRAPGKGVELQGRRIAAITMVSGKTYRGKMFVDATYEGDLMASAGVDYHVGREANSEYGETFNGIQVGVLHHGHWFKKPVDPYVVPGDRESGLLPRISPNPPGTKGDGDRRIQAYCYRMCLSNVPENRIPFPKPEGYDPKQYELLLRVLETGWRETFNKFDPIPNHKTDTNNHGPFSTDNIGYNYDYPEGSYARRREILQEHERYQKGLMYFLANDTRVPDDVRTKVATWGLARDEFVDNGGWPHQIYVREARRLIGEYVMTEHDCLDRKETPRSVGMGSYTIDSHNVQRYVTPEGHVQNEGDIGVKTPRPYEISYGALTPKRDQCENLLVPVCVSSSHIAFGSIRMEPVFMILGQSAATAAALSIDDGIAVQDLPYARLRERLLEDGQVLDLPEKN